MSLGRGGREAREGGGDLGTEWLPTAKLPQRVEVVNTKN